MGSVLQPTPRIAQRTDRLRAPPSISGQCRQSRKPLCRFYEVPPMILSDDRSGDDIAPASQYNV
jgi:hypothetical protein